MLLCAFQSLDTLDNGKPFSDAVADIQNGARVIRYFAGMTDKIVGQTIPAGTSFRYRVQCFHTFNLWHFFSCLTTVNCI